MKDKRKFTAADLRSIEGETFIGIEKPYTGARIGDSLGPWFIPNEIILKFSSNKQIHIYNNPDGSVAIEADTAK